MRCLHKLVFFSTLAITSLLPNTTAGFSGEDLLNGKPWHHENITCRALRGDVADCRWVNVSNPVYRFDTGFSASAAHAIAWHADYIDSYLYSPLWWASAARGSQPVRSVRDRYLAGMANYWQLASLHFDDLTSTKEIEDTWRRYFSGTLVALEWAAEKDDVNAAYNILGLSMHAVEDFYSHSTWINDPARRKRTFLETSPAMRSRYALMSGAYERKNAPIQHGKYSFSCTAYTQRPIKGMLKTVCANILPTANLSFCEDYRACNQGRHMKTQIELFGGRPNMVVLAPPGIAMDNTMVARIGAWQRGLTSGKNEKFTGRRSSRERAFDAAREQATAIPGLPRTALGGRGRAARLPGPEGGRSVFTAPGAASKIDTIARCEDIIMNGDPCTYTSDFLFADAKNLAIITANQWITLIDRHMQRRHPAYWQKVKTCSQNCAGMFDYAKPPNAITRQFENYAQFPFQFLSAGHDKPIYQVREKPQDWYLRLEIKTDGARRAGTDADITVIGDHGERFVLDYLNMKDPHSPVRGLLGYNDFERGDRQAYTIGPFKTLPKNLTILNDTASRKQVVKAFFRRARDRMKGEFERMRHILRNMQDYVGIADVSLSEDDLYRATGRGPVHKTLRIEGGDEGVYDLTYTITRTGWRGQGQYARWNEYAVRLDKIRAIKESKVDGGTRHDEPFFFIAITAFGLDTPQYLSLGPYSKVDSGDIRQVGHQFAPIRLPPGSVLGIVNQAYESDKEKARDRNALFEKFKGGISKGDVHDFPEFISAWGTRIGGDWKIGAIRVYAFRHGYSQDFGKVLEMNRPTWLRENETKSWPLNTRLIHHLGEVDASYVTVNSIPLLTARQRRLINKAPILTPGILKPGRKKDRRK